MSSADGEVRNEFHTSVNMTAKEISEWLETEESQAVGQKSDGENESTGHESGRRIVDLLNTKISSLNDDDLAHMEKVTGYVKRHVAQGPPSTDVETSRWRYSLMNWGHDPLKDS